jgi:hypothetical protein
MNIQFLQKRAETFVSDNASGILTGVGVVGTVATAVLAGRATLKASEVIAKEEVRYDMDHDGLGEFDTKARVLAVWPLYLPPVAMGGITITSIVMANRMSAKRAAALAAAYGLSESRFQEYRTKVEERAVRDEIAQDHVTNNPPGKEVVVITGGEVLCLDLLSGRYFHSTVEQIKRCENWINHKLFEEQYVSLSEFYDELGLEGTTLSDHVGWNQVGTGPVEIKISTAKTPNEQPCITFDFNVAPISEFKKYY